MTEHISTDPDTGAQKGVKDAEYALMPVLPLEEVAKVYGYGCRKYAARNWEKGYAWTKSFSALMRHCWSFWRGEDRDPESGLHHLAHAAFHCLALMEYGRTHPEKDDRSPQPQPGQKWAGYHDKVPGEDLVRFTGESCVRCGSPMVKYNSMDFKYCSSLKCEFHKLQQQTTERQ